VENSKKKSKKILCHQNKVSYPSISETARALKLQRSHIREVLNGKTKFTKGYSFEYVK
jgi:plasmid maintenance system antidote protein VapI